VSREKEGADRVDVLKKVSLVLPLNQGRAQLAHRFDGRYEPMNPKELVPLLVELAAAIDVSGVDYILGFPEGGVIPAFAFAQIVDRPLILSTRLALDPPRTISFEEPHSGLGTTHYIRGLHEGDHVVVIEDEVTTGRTVINAVRALRRSGVRIDTVGALLAVDDPGMWQSMSDEQVSLRVRFRLPGEYAARLRVDAAG
jgi:adenine/guanine phosphoribosyltransferase-like PRPP-binding protein